MMCFLQRLLLLLVSLLLEVSRTSEALAVLNRHYLQLDPSRVLDLLPDDMPVDMAAIRCGEGGGRGGLLFLVV